MRVLPVSSRLQRASLSFAGELIELQRGFMGEWTPLKISVVCADGWG